MLKTIKKSLAIILSATLLLSSVIVGGVISASADTFTSMPDEYTFDFNAGSVITTGTNTTSTDQFGNTFYPYHTNDDSGALTASQQTLTGTYNGDVDALVLTSTGGHVSYIPTDANGYPYIIEPNTEYVVTIRTSVKAIGGYNGYVIGSGAFGAYSATTTNYDGVNNWWSTRTGTVGGNGNVEESAALGFYPLYKAHNANGDWSTGTWSGSGFESAGMASYWTGGYSSDSYDLSRNMTLYMKTGDFTPENGKFTVDGVTYGQYFTIGATGALDIAIDSITITKASTVTFDANGGYFGDYAAEGATTTDTAKAFIGSAITAPTPNHPDSSKTFEGWSLDGATVIDTDTMTSDIAGKTLKAVWSDESLVYTFSFNKGETKTFGYNESSVDQFGNTFYPYHGQSDANSTLSVSQETIENTSVGSIGALVIDNTSSTFSYVPTDENGYPFIIEPNTEYDINVKLYLAEVNGYSGIVIGSGVPGAYAAGTSNMSFWDSYAGTAGGAANLINPSKATGNGGYWPIWKAHNDTGAFETGTRPADNAMASDGFISHWGTYADGNESYTSTRYRNFTLPMLTGNFAVSSGKISFAATNGSQQVAPYLVISGAYNTKVAIDSITITKQAKDVTVNFDANGGRIDTTSVTGAPGTAISAVPTNSDPTLKFVGWSWYKDSYSPANTITSGMEDKTLYAIWAQSITATFDANGGTFEDSTTSKELTYNEGAAVVAPTAAKKMNTFVGWAESPEGAVVTLPSTASFDMSGKTYYAIWQFNLHGDYDTFNRVIDYSKYVVYTDGGALSGNNFNSYVAHDNFSYPWNSVGHDQAVGSIDNNYLHYKAPQNIGGTDYYPGGWAPHTNMVITETGTHTNSGDMTDANNVYLPENTTYRVKLRIKPINFSGQTAKLSIGYGATFVAASPSKTIAEFTESNEWIEVSGVFTTPASYTEGSEKCFLNLSIGNCSANNWAFEYMIDTLTIEKVTATTIYTVNSSVSTKIETVYGAPGSDLVLPSNIVTETYNADATGAYATQPIDAWFSNADCTEATVTKFANADVSVYGTATGEATWSSTLNQDGFCGFDTYPDAPASVSADAAYSGTKGLKATSSTTVELKNASNFNLKAGKTYLVSLMYKSVGDASVSVGMAKGADVVDATAVTLNADGNWNKATVTFTATEGSAEGYVPVIIANGVYVDTVAIFSATESIMTTTEDGTNLRFLMGYTLNNNAIVLDGEALTVTERGITVSDTLTFKKTDKFDDCWSFNEATGTLIYSANIEGFTATDTDKLVARGYVKLSDGNTYYTDYLTASAEGTEPVNVVPADGEYVYLPVGTTLTADVEAKATFFDFISTGMVLATDAFANGQMVRGAYAIFEGEVDAAGISVPAELLYEVHSGTYEELSVGPDLHMATYTLDQVDTADSANYIFITDVHYDGNNTTITNQMRTIAKIANADDSIDFVVVGGDITTGMYLTKEAAIERTQAALAPLAECTKPVIVLRGNHDDNSYHVTIMGDDGKTPKYELTPEWIVSDKDWDDGVTNFVNSSDVASKFVHDSMNATSSYYYYDLVKDGKTTRVIALNASDYGVEYNRETGVISAMPQSTYSWEIDDEGEFHDACGYTRYGYTGAQLRWLAEEALGTGDFDDVVMLSHMGVDGSRQSHWPDTPVTNSSALINIMAAFNNKTSYTASLVDNIADYDSTTGTYVERAAVAVSADFSAKSGRILTYQYGHTHGEMVNYMTSCGVWEICTATANEVNANETGVGTQNPAYPWYYQTQADRIGTNDTACFDIMSVNSNVAYKLNIGSGYNVTMYQK